MPTPRDPAVTEYVRMRIKPMLDNKEILGKDLARAVGVSASSISSLWNTGIGGRSIDGFARVLKFKNADELRKAAYDWYREQDTKAAARLEEPAVQEALAIQKLNHPNIGEDQWRSILARFGHPDFAGRSAEYWLLALGQEAAQDMLAARAATDAVSEERRHARWQENHATKVMQGEFRTAARTKKELKALEAANAEREAAEKAAADKAAPKPPLLAERRR